jgi:hypothetical protein
MLRGESDRLICPPAGTIRYTSNENEARLPSAFAAMAVVRQDHGRLFHRIRPGLPLTTGAWLGMAIFTCGADKSTGFHRERHLMRQSAKRIVTTTVIAGAMFISLPMATASAINGVPCGNRTDLVKIAYNGDTASRCFANSGVVDVTLRNVYEVSSGNNEIRVVMNGVVYSLSKWQTRRILDSGQTLTRLRIL